MASKKPNSTLAVPTIHPNGTSAEELLRNLDTAWQVLDSAKAVLRLCAPNGRDYYVQQNPGSLAKACQQHLARMQSIDDVMEEIEFLMTKIDEQRPPVTDASET